MLEYLQNNSVEIVAIIGAVVTLASLIANLTPSETDNKIVEKISGIVNLLALNIKKK
jgi:hypothetical protein